MEYSPASLEYAIFTPFETSTSILLMHNYNKVSLQSLSRIGTSRVSTLSTRTTSWLSPSWQTSWCLRSSSTRAVPLTSYIGKLSRDSRSSLTLPILKLVHSLVLQARE
ncbi:hypothetical protein AAZX31_08G274100 [Glycine max]